MFIYALLVLLPALALTQNPNEQLRDKLFNVLDKDGDGQISNLENEQVFLGFDTNKDGVVNNGEFSTAIVKIDPAFNGHEDKLFALLDDDSNGQADKTDIDNAFGAADENRNGFINKTEFDQAFSQVVSHIGSR